MSNSLYLLPLFCENSTKTVPRPQNRQLLILDYVENLKEKPFLWHFLNAESQFQTNRNISMQSLNILNGLIQKLLTLTLALGLGARVWPRARVRVSDF